MNGRAFIDTNVFLYAHDEHNKKKRAIARDLVFTLYKTGDSVVSTQVLAEFFQNFAGKFKLSYADALKELHFMSRCKVVEQSLSLLLAGVSLYNEHSISFWDSMIIAAAIEAEAEILYSEDLNHGQLFHGVKVINPFE